MWRVYPRVCGGTQLMKQTNLDLSGLSPRVRGNQSRSAGSPSPVRSIPACAGEPGQGESGSQCLRVYPRVCGGTYSIMSTGSPVSGLSPRVRGNQHLDRWTVPPSGSIPACAGEPQVRNGHYMSVGVYPRVCGGTVSFFCFILGFQGLSPRVRGNRPQRQPPCPQNGSIPACAGEPHHIPYLHGARAVYPRVCGGTGDSGFGSDNTQGLSPRVRGNLPTTSVTMTIIRSIPACAGEPRVQHRGNPEYGVYPRVCGGTVRSVSASQRV